MYYWSKYNPDFRNYNGVAHGGDCTNFISQALHNGRWPDKSGWYRSTGAWWYEHFPGNPLWLEHASWTWTNAGRWAQFALNSGRTYNLRSVWSMGLADILQMDTNGDGVIDHSMIVSRREQ